MIKARKVHRRKYPSAAVNTGPPQYMHAFQRKRLRDVGLGQVDVDDGLGFEEFGCKPP